eukprot:scaffold135240_cov62-Attheya_sp.AAC.5
MKINSITKHFLNFSNILSEMQGSPENPTLFTLDITEVFFHSLSSQIKDALKTANYGVPATVATNEGQMESIIKLHDSVEREENKIAQLCRIAIAATSRGSTSQATPVFFATKGGQKTTGMYKDKYKAEAQYARNGFAEEELFSIPVFLSNAEFALRKQPAVRTSPRDAGDVANHTATRATKNAHSPAPPLEQRANTKALGTPYAIYIQDDLVGEIARGIRYEEILRMHGSLQVVAAYCHGAPVCRSSRLLLVKMEGHRREGTEEGI